MRTLCLFVLSLVVAVPAFADDEKQASTTNKDDNDCLFFRTVQNWRVLDDRHLVIWAPGQNDPYLLATLNSVWNLKSQEQLAFIDGNHDGRLCGFGGDAIATTNNPGWNDKATIASVRRLDDAALAQVSEQYKVKLDRKRPKDEGKTTADADR